MVEALKPGQLSTYFALTEAFSLLHYAVRQQLKAEGDLSYVQFQILAKLADADGQLTMTDLADEFALASPSAGEEVLFVGHYAEEVGA